MLAEEDTEIEYLTDDDASVGNALDMGQDDQLADDFEAVTEIPQNDTSGIDAAVDAISEEDSGTIGDDSDVNDTGDSDDDEGTGFMTYVMYIGAAILVLALIGGVAHVVMNRKNAGEFSRE